MWYPSSPLWEAADMDARFVRNIPALTEAECALLGKKRVLVVGCGGLGGHIIDLLTRVGIGSLRVVDGDVFEPTNLNRQLLSDMTVLGRPKAEVALEHIRRVRPEAEARVRRAPISSRASMTMWQSRISSRTFSSVMNRVTGSTAVSGETRRMCSAATSALGLPRASVSDRSCRFRLVGSKTSPSTTRSVPTPTRARSSMMCPPRPPQPMTATVFRCSNSHSSRERAGMLRA